MADFVAVLKKALDGSAGSTPASRQRVYDKARQTIAGKLAALNPPPSPAIAERQRRSLEDAIAQVEKEYAAADDPLAELEGVFASLKNPQPRPLTPPPAPRAEAGRVSSRPATLSGAASAHRAPPVQAAATHAATSSLADAPPPVPLGRSDLDEPLLAHNDDHFGSDEPVEMADDGPTAFAARRGVAARPRNYGPLVVAALVVAVVAGGGYGIWLNRDAFGALFGGGTQTASAPASPEPAATTAPALDNAADAAAPAPAAPAATDVAANQPAGEAKFTQRLTEEGTEVDPGPGAGGGGIGEGTTVAALTQPASALPPVSAPAPAAGAPAPTDAAETAAVPPPAADAPAADAPAAAATDTTTVAAADTSAQVAVGQKAIFYEERTASAEGSAEPGTIVWSIVQESPGGGLPPEPAIRAEATIPGKDMQLRMTVRRNADPTLPASHIIEMIFLTPPNFEGGGINNILRVAMKPSEQEAGSPLIGIPAKIADGFFLVALNDSKAETNANLALLNKESWIDVPVVYKSGRRALFTMEKGIPGEKVFDEAIKAWQTKTASAG